MKSDSRFGAALPTEVCSAVEDEMASREPFANDFYILDVMSDSLTAKLERLAPDLPPAAELLGAIRQRPTNDYRRMFAETTLRSAIGHAYRRLVSGTPCYLELGECAAVLSVAAQYVAQGGTATPLQDGSLVALDPDSNHGLIWSEEHSYDTYGRALRALLMDRYRMLPVIPDAASIEVLRTRARLLEELLPALAPSALRHVQIVACMPSAAIFSDVQSSSQLHLSGIFFLRESLGSPWWVAEHRPHESLHLKLYDLHHGHTLVQSGGGIEGARPVISPGNPSLLSGANKWYVWRVLVAYHVYVHLALLCAVAEQREPELAATYGPCSDMIQSHKARGRSLVTWAANCGSTAGRLWVRPVVGWRRGWRCHRSARPGTGARRRHTAPVSRPLPH